MGRARRCLKILAPSSHIDLAAGVGEDKGPDTREEGFEKCRAKQAYGDHVECLHGMVDEHLVHDDLKEQRGHQPDDLQHERDEQYLGQIAFGT